MIKNIVCFCLINSISILMIFPRKLSLFFLFLLVSLNSQRIEKFSFGTISVSQGLSQGRVKAILQDQTGFLWFGTADGLNRYDGYSMLTFRFNAEKTNTIRDNTINDLKELPDGKIVIAHNEGVDIFDPVTEMFTPVIFNFMGNNPPRIKDVEKIIVPGKYNGFIYLGTQAGLVKHYFDKSYDILVLQLQTDPAENDRSIKALLEDERGNIWVGTGGEGLYLFDPVKNSSTNLYKPSPVEITNKIPAVTCIGTDGNGRIFTGELKYLQVFDLEGKHIRKNISNGFAIPIAFNTFSNNTIFVAYLAKGLYLYSFDNNSFTKIVDKDGTLDFGHLDFLSIVKDRNDRYWCGSNGYGIKYFSAKEPIIQKFDDFGNNLKSIRSFLELSDGTVFISGYKELQQLPKGFDTSGSYKGRSITVFDAPFVAYCMLEDIYDRGNGIWLGNEGNGLFRYSIKSNTSERIGRVKDSPDEIHGDFIQSMIIGSDSLLWIATELGLNAYNPITKKTLYYPASIEKDTISSFGWSFALVESNNSIFLGTSSYGVIRFDKSTKQFSNFLNTRSKPLAIPSNDIRTIFIKGDSLFCLGTGYGLVVYNSKTQTIQTYSSNDGLPGDLIYGILEDNNGNLWLSTNAGLAMFNPKRKIFSSYILADGIQGYEYNTKAYLKLSKGRLLFGGTEGFNLVDPKKIEKDETPPKILISGLNLFSKKIPVGEYNGKVILDSAVQYKKSVSFDYNQNSIAIEFTDFIPDTRFVYYLEGLEKEYSLPTSDRKAIYSNLAPGTYYFKVATLDRQGNLAENEATLQIIINPPYWATWWFRTLIVLAVITLIGGGTYRKISSIKKRNEELEKIVSERTKELARNKEELEQRNAELQEMDSAKNHFFSMLAHDIRSPFTAILGYLQIVNEEYEELTENERKSYLRNLFSVSQDLFDSINNVLHWFRIEVGRVNFQPEDILLAKVISEVEGLLAVNFKDKELELVTEINEETVIYTDKVMIKVVLQNLLTNAVKFSEKGNAISISGERKGDFYSISINDSGKGMTPEEVNKLFKKEEVFVGEGTQKEKGTGLGLLICKEFVERGGGEISVTSIPGEGSSFIFTVPLKKETY
ncbi:MAG: Adaptive-response sensory-kinase SasA [Ignavibacteriaceae bacterium]|nr:Adaptive-response sensory-kinase SasA [Ignavibacteriaceae bacterium]MBW7874275.1 hypothetical protein [Ignavibacteria bacterium]WKZ71554.1 MAG: ATP-binding protein [Ignavibacteriaceae bacterium]